MIDYVLHKTLQNIFKQQNQSNAKVSQFMPQHNLKTNKLMQFW